MNRTTRRAVLAGGASTLAAALAGCSTRSRRGEPEPTTTGRATDRSTGTGPSRTATETPGETVRADGLLLPSLDVGGSPGDLVALRPPGKVALLDFFATWCPPCGPEMEHLRAVRARYDSTELSVVSITQETDESAIESFWEEYRGTWPVVMDPGVRAGQRFGVTNLPTILVLTPDGTETERRTGLVGESVLVEAIDAALERAEPA